MRRFIGPSVAVLSILCLFSTGRADDKAPAAGEEVTRQPGSIIPAVTVRISPRVGGTVQSVLVEAGAIVKAGQVLAQLDRADFELVLKRATAVVEHARAAVAEAEARIARGHAAIDGAEAAVKEATAQRQFQQQKAARMRELLKNNAVDQRLVDEADSQAQVAAARLGQAEAQLAAVRAEPDRERLAVARADVAVAEAQRDLAKLRLDGTEIRSPISGTVLVRHAIQGEAVAPYSEAHPVVLFEIADLTHLEAAIDLPDRLYNRVTVGTPCEMQVDAIPGHKFKGRVARLAPTISPATRTASVRVQIDVPDGNRDLRPGMYGVVSILAK